MPFQYSFEEKTEMILIYGECNRNELLAAETYALRFPLHRHPSHQIFKSLVTALRETGTFKAKTKVFTNKSVTNELNQARVLNLVENDPHVSSRNISGATGISKSSVLRILTKYQYHPYHMELHHGEDYVNRVAFCEWAEEQIRNDEQFFDRVLFTDESCFKNNGVVNKHNLHYWATQNPHWMREQNVQNRWSLNVWGGVVNDRIVGPFFFDGHLNGEMYRNFLRDELNGLLDKVVPVNQRFRLWFQQNGAPPHFSREAREELTLQFGENWIGRGGPIHWPARSPDLTPSDFFLWGALKERVYREQPTTREDMRLRIVHAFAEFNNVNIAATVSANLKRRLRLCIEQNGHQFITLNILCNGYKFF